MATNIPPHNLGEIIDAVVMQIDNPEISIGELMMSVQGLIFLQAGLICGREGIKSAYFTGRGKILVRAKTEIKPEKAEAT